MMSNEGEMHAYLYLFGKGLLALLPPPIPHHPHVTHVYVLQMSSQRQVKHYKD